MAHPGPWHWGDFEAGENPSALIDADGEVVGFADGMRIEDFGETSRLLAAAPELLAMLRELEWHGDEGPQTTCPECTGIKPKHYPDCRLAALLGRFA